MTGTVTLKAQWKKKSTSDSTSDSTSGSTSGSSSEQNYSISISDRIENGKVKASVSQAEKGDKVTITVTPNEDHEINKVTVKDADGQGRRKQLLRLKKGKQSF